MSNETWTEPRGPHMPVATIRIPLGAWPFLIASVVVVAGRIGTLIHYVDVMANLGTLFGLGVDPLTVTVFLVMTPLSIAWTGLGAALWFRHPDIHRTDPLLASGAVLVAAASVLEALRSPIIEAIVGPGEPSVDPYGLPGVGYGFLVAVLRLVGLIALSAGLERARRRGLSADIRVPVVVLTLVAILGPAFMGVPTPAWPDEIMLAGSATFVANVLLSLAWASLGWFAYTGSIAGSDPSRAWRLAALAGIGRVVAGFVGGLLYGGLAVVRQRRSTISLLLGCVAYFGDPGGVGRGPRCGLLVRLARAP